MHCTRETVALISHRQIGRAQQTMKNEKQCNRKATDEKDPKTNEISVSLHEKCDEEQTIKKKKNIVQHTLTHRERHCTNKQQRM